MTKEELLKQNALLAKEIEEYGEANKRRRREFAKSFGWFEKSRVYNFGEEGEARLPSWEEIFVEIGKLLAVDKSSQRDEIMNDIGNKLMELENKISAPKP